MKTILFLGRSIEGILSDARRAFGELEVEIVAREGDALDPPEGLEAKPVSEFRPVADEKYRVIANGGTAAQLVPVLLRITNGNCAVEVFDLQRDGVNRLWPEEK